jgi:hypothetical protein
MTQPRPRSTQSGALQFRMRSQLRRLQIGFSIVLILFSFSMMIVLFRRQEKSPLEYLLWVGSIAVWGYAIWYALSARLTLTAEYIAYRAGFTRLLVEWKRIDSLGFEASGPVIYVQESDQKQLSNKQAKRINRRKKLPIYLFMTHWKTQADWKNDPVGKEILTNAAWLIKT